MNKAALVEHFKTRKEINSTIHLYFPSPQSLDTMDRISYQGNYARQKIAEFETLIETLRSYDLLLYERAQTIATAPYHMEIRLTREKRYYQNKVFYYLKLYKVFEDENIKPEQIESTTYPGTERRKAIADFEAYKKSHAGIVAVMDIEKSKWER